MPTPGTRGKRDRLRQIRRENHGLRGSGRLGTATYGARFGLQVEGLVCADKNTFRNGHPSSPGENPTEGPRQIVVQVGQILVELEHSTHV